MSSLAVCTREVYLKCPDRLPLRYLEAMEKSVKSSSVRERKRISSTSSRRPALVNTMLSNDTKPLMLSSELPVMFVRPLKESMASG